MPNSFLPSRKGLQTSAELLGCRRNVISGRPWQFLAQPFSIIDMLPLFGANVMRSVHTVDQRSIFSVIGTLARTLSVPSVTAPHCLSCIYHIDGLSSEPKNRLLLSTFQRSIMSACLHVLSRAESASHHLATVDGKRAQPLSSMIRAGICYSYKSCGYHRSINRTSHNQELWRPRVALCCSGANGNSWKLGSCIEPRNKDFQLSHALPYSAGAAHDLSFDSAPRDDQLENSVVDPNRNSLGDRSLKLLSGSCYLPHPDKEETGGEDAHFICDDEQAIGVADGVGGWADFGVNAGQYARELMFNSVSAIQDEPQGLIDSARVLEKAYSNTKAKGSSTACIVALTDQGIHAVNLGDSGFIVVRDGSTIFRSPVQQHDFNFTYQLESGNGSDLPSSAQVFKIAVESGDVIVAGTDGLFDNLYNNEINAILVHASRAKLAPQVAAQKIAALARQRAHDKNRQTPFSTAAQDAGYRYYGGKLDDVTVVVSYITASSV